MTLPLFITFTAVLAGIYGLVFSKSLVKSIIFLNIIQTALVQLFLLFSQAVGQGLPIIGASSGKIIDPLPQALMITAIVIGSATTSLALMISIKIFHYYGSLQWKDVFGRED